MATHTHKQNNMDIWEKKNWNVNYIFILNFYKVYRTQNNKTYIFLPKQIKQTLPKYIFVNVLRNFYVSSHNSLCAYDKLS
jgi:hypothetical protein